MKSHNSDSIKKKDTEAGTSSENRKSKSKEDKTKEADPSNDAMASQTSTLNKLHQFNIRTTILTGDSVAKKLELTKILNKLYNNTFLKKRRKQPQI